ncbi:MAG: tRNA pseudouridine synthase A [Bacteroidota bacterium]|nr:tRNA pseudouridine synthase A [Bacteroidota bacterium]
MYGKLDVELMNRACEILKEYQDFECFSKVGADVKTFLCDIYHASWQEKEGVLIFEIMANRFLRNMVRAIVGTMVELGQYKIDLQDFRKIIESKNRSEAGFSVPAQGLFLADVSYPREILNL